MPYLYVQVQIAAMMLFNGFCRVGTDEADESLTGLYIETKITLRCKRNDSEWLKESN